VIVAWIVALRFIPWADVTDTAKALFLFLGVFPLLNALFDVLSYAATLALMRIGLRRAGPLLWGFYDLGIALFLFLGLGATLTLILRLMNLIAGVPILDLHALFGGLHQSPGDYWWLYAMVFSTILPTGVHFILSLMGLQGMCPPFIRRPIANWLRDDATTGEWMLGAFALGTIWWLPFIIVGAAGWGLWQLQWFVWLVQSLASIYLFALTWLAQAIGAA